MNTVFIGGSRKVSRLPGEVEERLNEVISNGLKVIVGDANGADKAVQNHFLKSAYTKVTVFCSGRQCRNNLGNWPTQNINVQRSKKDFQFYALKDREMAKEADAGLMIWDGKSAGTVLNILRLLRTGKEAELINAREKTALSFKTIADWDLFLKRCDEKFKAGLRKRATPEEWKGSISAQQASLFD